MSGVMSRAVLALAVLVSIRLRSPPRRPPLPAW